MARARIIIALFLAYALFALPLNSVGTVNMEAINSFHITHQAAGTTDGFKDIPIAICSFFAALFLPRLGYRRGLILGLILVAAASVAMPLIPSFWTTRLQFVIVGISFAIVKISVYSSIGLIAKDGRDHAGQISLLEGLFSFGCLTPPLLFSLFIDPKNPASLSWLNVYWLIAVGCVIAALLVLVAPLDETGASVPNASLKGAVMDNLTAMGRLLLEAPVWSYLAAAFLYVLIEQSFTTWLPTFNNEVLHIKPDVSAQMSSFFPAALMLGRLLGSMILRRFEWITVLTSCLLTAAAVVIVVLPMASMTHNVAHTLTEAPLAAFLFPAIGLCLGPIYPAIASVILNTHPKERHSTMTSLIVIFSAIGGTTGSFITGRVFGAVGGQFAFFMSLIPMALLLIALFLLRWTLKRRGHEAVAVGASVAH